MSNTHLIEEFLYARIFEFGAIVPSDVLNLQIVVVHDMLGEALEDNLSL